MINNQKILLILILIGVFGLICASNFVLAQEITDYPTISGADTPGPDTTLPQYIKYLFNFGIALGGILAFVVFAFGGVMWAMSAGNPVIIGIAKAKMLKGIMGLALLLASYLIIVAINPDLTVLTLEDLDWKEYTGRKYVPADIDAKTYKEMPIGLLIEEILAKNISCFDADGNLRNCRNRKTLQTAKTNIFAPDTHYNYCYEYDEDGNKKELLKYHDRLACVKKLEKALLKKSVDLKVVSEELKMWSELLKEKSGELKGYAHNCTCLRCSQTCRGCGCDNSSCTCDCFNNVDLCPDRDKMNFLRRTTIPFIIEEIEKKRIESRDLIYGADPINDKYIIYQPNSHLGPPIEKKYYLKERDPNTVEGEKFLTIEEALTRLKGLKNELKQDLVYLKEAEELTKFPYGKRLSLAEYQEKILEGNIDKAQFKDIDITEYCQIFHCIEENDGICSKYKLNSEQGKLCNIFNLDGEPVTFYFPTEGPAHYSEIERIVFESKPSTGEAGIPDITVKAPPLPALPTQPAPPTPPISAPPISAPPISEPEPIFKYVWVAKFVGDKYVCFSASQKSETDPLPIFTDSALECCQKHYGEDIGVANPDYSDTWELPQWPGWSGNLTATKYYCGSGY